MTPIQQAVETVAAQLREHPSRPWNLDEMAAAARYSTWHFRRAFAAQVGEPPARYLARLRLAETQRLLAVTDLSVDAICRRVGYSSVGTFVTNFRRRVGMTPGQYRQRARAEVPA